MDQIPENDTILDENTTARALLRSSPTIRRRQKVPVLRADWEARSGRDVVDPCVNTGSGPDHLRFLLFDLHTRSVFPFNQADDAILRDCCI